MKTEKWWVKTMSAAKWIRFAVLLSFAGLFCWLAYVRGEIIWLLPFAIFAAFALRTVARAGASQTFNSGQYWIKRYDAGKNSGGGSYGRLAQFKADILNAFVEENKISSVIEFGSGDGAQLTLAKYPSYQGFDISENAIRRCQVTFKGDSTKSFRLLGDYASERADLSLSLDVIYHLVEDGVFQEYMQRLFFAGERFVIVYSSNRDEATPDKHVRHRKFTDWIEKNQADFTLLKKIPNKYPFDPEAEKVERKNSSFAEFYIFGRLPAKSG